MSMASAQADSSNYGSVDFGSRDGGYGWVVGIVVVVAAVALVWLWKRE
jgi:ABC-type multidrug transport system permease subunit